MGRWTAAYAAVLIAALLIAAPPLRAIDLGYGSVMYDGAVVAELEGPALTEEAIVAASLNLGAAA